MKSSDMSTKYSFVLFIHYTFYYTIEVTIEVDTTTPL